MVISKESWTDTRWARKQWLPFYMAKRKQVGKIIYVDRHRAWWRSQTETKKVEEGVISVRQESLVIPFERMPFIRALNRRIISWRLKPLLDPSLKWVVIYYHPYDVDLVKGLSGKAFTVFDWTEDWAVFHGDDEMKALQQEAVMSSDMVLTVTESLRKKTLAWGKPASQAHTLLNATTFTPEQAGDAAKEKPLPDVAGPRIGFVGHAGPWFDAGLISRLAARHPDWQWIIAGGVGVNVREILGRHPSVHLLGIQPPSKLMPMMCGCDVLVAPYVPEFSGDATKLYDYLATGKPVISAPCETAEQLQPFVTVCDGDEQWSLEISRALTEDSADARQTRMKESTRHHWNARVSRVLELLGYD